VNDYEDEGVGLGAAYLVNLAYLVQIRKAGSKNPLDFSLRNHKLLFPQPVYYPSSFNLFSWPPEKFSYLLVGILLSLGS